MALSRSGIWTSLFSTAPSSAAGQPIPGASGWRIIVQAAKVTTTHTTLTLGTYPQPTWVDITAHCFEIDDESGDPGDDTRTPVRQCVIRCTSGIAALTGDPFNFSDSINDRFGTQCFVRWGFYDTVTHGWLPMFAGVIDTVIEDWRPQQPLRVFELVCFDLMYLIAGHRSPVDFGTGATTVETAAATLLDDIDYLFNADWSLGGYTSGIQGPSNQSALTLFDRIAATCDSIWYCNRGGTLALILRNTYVDLRATYWLVDEYTGAGLPTRSSTYLPTGMRWINSVDRFTKSTLFASVNVVGTPVGVASSPVVASRKFTQRRDCPGTDVATLNTTYGELGSRADTAAERYDETSYLDHADFDTATAGRAGQPALGSFIHFLQRSSHPAQASYTVMRTRTPTLTHTPLVAGTSSLITIEHQQFRWQARHKYRRMIV